MKRHELTIAIIIFLFLPLIGAGCARSSNQHRSDVAIELTAPLFPPTVGRFMVSFRITDADGNPLDGAAVTAKGDMSHAGMAPVLATAAAAGDGVYVIPAFEWTMAGDWSLNVEAELADGTTAATQFDIPVDHAAICSESD